MSPIPPVIIVLLRRPRRDAAERRTDPMYEFGSFGCTGCHRGNLMNPDRIDRLKGARLAFAQGGKLGFRLVYLTPPVEPRAFADRAEAKWSPADMPFRYAAAPVLAYNGQVGDFPAVEKFARSTKRESIEGGFASLFRSRATPLADDIATELVRVYEQMRAAAGPEALAVTYEQALPHPPAVIDQNRSATYEALTRGLENSLPTTRRCGDRRPTTVVKPHTCNGKC